MYEAFKCGNLGKLDELLVELKVRLMMFDTAWPMASVAHARWIVRLFVVCTTCIHPSAGIGRVCSDECFKLFQSQKLKEEFKRHELGTGLELYQEARPTIEVTKLNFHTDGGGWAGPCSIRHAGPCRVSHTDREKSLSS